MGTELELPCNEELARRIVASLQGILFSSDFDVSNVPLDRVLSPTKSNMGIRMRAVTEGPGRHQIVPYVDCFVEDGWVYATFNTTSHLAGGLTTYELQKTEKGLTCRRTQNHLRSFF
jgi:hypothetical protein